MKQAFTALFRAWRNWLLREEIRWRETAGLDVPPYDEPEDSGCASNPPETRDTGVQPPASEPATPDLASLVKKRQDESRFDTD